MRHYGLLHWIVVVAIIVILIYGKEIVRLIDRLTNGPTGRHTHNAGPEGRND